MRTIQVNRRVGQSRLESGEVEVNQLMHKKTNAVLWRAISPVRTGRNLCVKRLTASEQRDLTVNGRWNPINRMWRGNGRYTVYVIPWIGGSLAVGTLAVDDFECGQCHNGWQSGELHSIDSPSSSRTFFSEKHHTVLVHIEGREMNGHRLQDWSSSQSFGLRQIVQSTSNVGLDDNYTKPKHGTILVSKRSN